MANNPDLVRKTARQNYDEFIAIYRYCGIDNVRFEGSISVKKYLEMFTPIMKWLLSSQMIGLPLESPGREDCVRRCFNEADNLNHPGLVIHCLLDLAPASLVANEVARLCHVACTCNDNAYPAHHVLEAFAKALLRSTASLNLKLRNQKQPLMNAIQQTFKASLDKVAKSCLRAFLR